MRIIGATGAGKTTLILAQLLADAAADRGAVFIDPKGDAVTALLPRLPETSAGKVVLFDPASRAAPPCLNVLQGAADGSDTDVITGDHLEWAACAASWVSTPHSAG
jgi:Type IV secretion-system coupling protein DNA-binding domain